MQVPWGPGQSGAGSRMPGAKSSTRATTRGVWQGACWGEEREVDKGATGLSEKGVVLRYRVVQ